MRKQTYQTVYRNGIAADAKDFDKNKTIHVETMLHASLNKQRNQLCLVGCLSNTMQVTPRTSTLDLGVPFKKEQTQNITRGGDLPINVGIKKQYFETLIDSKVKDASASPKSNVAQSVKSLPQTSRCQIKNKSRQIEPPKIMSRKATKNLKNESDLVFKPYFKAQTSKAAIQNIKKIEPQIRVVYDPSQKHTNNNNVSIVSNIAPPMKVLRPRSANFS